MPVDYLVGVCLTCCWSYRLLFNVITIYGVACVQLAHFSLGDRKDISIAHFIIITKSEVSPFPIFIILLRGCVPELLVSSYSVTYWIYIPGKPGFLSTIVQFMMRSNSRIRFALQIVVVLLYKNRLIIIIINKDVELIKCLSDFFMSIV